MLKDNKLFGKAFEYAVRGYSIIPLRRNKHPLIAQWKQFQEVPAGEEQIQAWWKANPSANVGIITGKISGITIIDIDTSESGDAVPLDTFPKTFTVKTPTGGYHLYYEYEESIQQTANTFPQFPHVDIRNDGGYVVAPPSECDYVKHKVRVKGFYKVEHNFPIAPFPVKLFKTEKENKKINSKASDILKSFNGMQDGDGRNNALAKVIGKFLKVLRPSEFNSVGWQMALTANQQFKEPLPEKEVKATFESIVRRESKKPLSEVEFLTTEKGVVIDNEENVYRTLKNDDELQGHFRENMFVGMVESDFSLPGKWEVLQRADVIAVQMHLMRNYVHFTRVGHGTVEDAITHYAKENRVSPPVEWMKNLEWDKTKRLDKWLCNVYGVEDSKYHRAVASNWMKGLVKRIVRPGCKFDYVLVLEGKQGIKKSTSLSVLGGDWHVETVFAPDNKDFFMLFSGKAIVEFSEGETLSRTEAKRLKAVITMQFDKYRPPYERAAKEFPRQCVFAMTTNQEQYLKDETGNRRWLPVACKGDADLDWLRANRDQLFAEAYHRVIVKNETTYEFPEEETRIQQAMRETTDPREELIYNWYFTKLMKSQREEGITTREAYLYGVQGLDKSSAWGGKEMGKMEEMVIAALLKEKLFLEKRRMMETGQRFYKFYPTKESEAIAPLSIPSEVMSEF